LQNFVVVLNGLIETTVHRQNIAETEMRIYLARLDLQRGGEMAHRVINRSRTGPPDSGMIVREPTFRV